MSGNTENKPKRDLFWDVVKGIGIICILLGHSCRYVSVIAFVYLFHLPLFFFVTGYLFDAEKWKGRLNEFIGSRITPTWVRFMIYGAFFVLTHNFFVSRGALAGDLYNHTAMLASWLNYAVFATSDSLGGALWFIPVWLFAICIFAALKEILKKEWLLAASCALCAAVGLFLYSREVGIAYHLQTSFLAIGFMYLGHALRVFVKDLRKFLNPAAGILCLAALIILRKTTNITMDLSGFHIPGAWIYIISPVGIYMVLCLAKYLSRLPGASAFSFLGAHSFDIMALHFSVIKLADIVYASLFGADRSLLINFPVSYADKLWIVYLLAGLLIPAAIGVLIDRAIAFFRKMQKVTCRG